MNTGSDLLVGQLMTVVIAYALILTITDVIDSRQVRDGSLVVNPNNAGGGGGSFTDAGFGPGPAGWFG